MALFQGVFARLFRLLALGSSEGEGINSSISL